MSPGGRPAPDPALIQRLFPQASLQVHRYVDLLINQGIDRGLLGPAEAARVWDRHILNCAVIAPAFPPTRSVCDLGSGAGLPGVVLALARPDLQVMLLEPLLRRAAFLEEVVCELALQNAVVLRARAEDVAATVQVDLVTARAVAPLERLARWARPLLRPGGALIAIKGESAAEELAAAGPGLAELGARGVQLQAYGSGVVSPETRVVRLEFRG